MRYPNLRYGNPAELVYYAAGMPLAALAHALRRDERTVRDWIHGRARVPWWVPELLRLRRMEADLRHRQMNMGPLLASLGVVAADVVQLHERRHAAAPQPVTPGALPAGRAAGR